MNINLKKIKFIDIEPTSLKLLQINNKNVNNTKKINNMMNISNQIFNCEDSMCLAYRYLQLQAS